MSTWRMNHNRSTPRSSGSRRNAQRLCQLPLAVPLHTLTGPLEHGALGVWDEVAVGALLAGCAIAYAVWFYLSGRGEKPPDSE